MAAEKKEKLLIENLLSSTDVFSRCINIIKPNYFDAPEYKPVVKFVSEYFTKYNNLPPFHVVNAEFDTDFTVREITTDQYQYTCDEVEKFCKQSAFINAMQEGYDLVGKHEIDAAFKKMTEAMLVSLPKDLGIDLYDNPEERLRKMLETAINYPTSIKGLDMHLDGGLARQTLSLFSANSGVGKSNMLANLGANYSLLGLHVLYITLELPEDMIYLRLASIETDTDINLWRQKIPEIASKLLSKKDNGAGSYKIKRLPGGTTPNAVRSYLKHYELEHKRKPDVIIIDYLDLMYPNGGIKNKGVFEQDKEKSEELTEILFIYNAIGISASQQNREALRMASPDQGVIAGGISKVNTVHNYISLIMDDQMLQRGEMIAWFLKTRTSSGKGKSAMLSFDQNTLVISDAGADKAKIMTTMIQRTAASKGKQLRDTPSNKKVTSIINGIQGLPSNDNPNKVITDTATDEPIIQLEDTAETDELLELMKTFGG